VKDGLPQLGFLRRAHECNYCHGVHGVAFARPPRVRPRLLWVRCACGRSHFACFRCAARVGTSGNGVKMIAECARGYWRRNKDKIAAERGAKGGR
jgi:hypothetical protein